MAKLNLDFTLIDESIVMYGFRALMSGAQIEDFKKNPVMLIQHNRPKDFAGKDDLMLPIGKWYDIRVEGNKLLAKPDFDDDDELAVKVQKKVEKGYLNGASIWIEPVGISEDKKDMLPGQSLPTLTKWGLLEASIVDIPNCRNSLAIRNSSGKRIELNANTENEEIKDYLKTILNNNKPTMDKKLLAVKLGLAEEATEQQISDKIGAILTANASVATLTSENNNLKQEIVSLKTAADAARVDTLVDGAVKEGKLTAEDAVTYKKLAVADFESTAALIAKMPGYESIAGKLGAGNDVDKAELDGLLKLSGIELYKNGSMERLQQISPAHFKLKYKEAFGVDYPESK